MFITDGSTQQIEDGNICHQHSGSLIIANPYDCHSFYACQFGNAMKIICPNNLIFNPKLENCDENYKVCINEEEPTVLNNVANKKEIMSEDIDDDGGEVGPTDSENESNTEATEFLNSTASSTTTDYPTSVPTSSDATSILSTISTVPIPSTFSTEPIPSTFSTEPIPSTISTESIPNECETCTSLPPNRCPMNDTEDPTFLPSDLFCDSFYLCYHSRPYEMFCPSGFYWSQEYVKCILERESNCTDSSGYKAPKCPAEGQFFIPHKERCNLFYYCENGIRTIQQCTAFQQWDVVEKKCKLDISAKCIKAIPRSQRAKYYTLL